MNSICILTDSTAQFPQPGFNGRNDVRVIPFRMELNGQILNESDEPRTNDLPPSVIPGKSPKLAAPSVSEFQEIFQSLGQHYSQIITIVMSSHLSPAFENAQKAAEVSRGRLSVSVIDSETTSIGLGVLVQLAAEAAASGQPAVQIEQMIRRMIPHVYMMVCTPGMSYLAQSGYVDAAQGFVGEMLGLLPIFTLEEGQLSAVEKVRNTRGLMDFMQEFILEFEEILHIAFIQSQPGLSHESKIMREHAQNCFPSTPFSEHTINPHLATLLGPRTVGLVAVEKVDLR